MRFFILILSLFVLVLSIAPCSDADCCCNEDTCAEGSDASSNNNHTSCTPFCSGCANFSISFEISHFLFEFQSFQIASPISLYQSVCVSSYINSFWQPPKLNA